MRPYLTKITRVFFIPLFVTIVIFTIAFNILLSLSQETIIEKAELPLTHEITLKHIYYIFPHIIILKDISLIEKSTSPDDVPFKIPIVMAKFSWWQTIKNRHLSITETVIHAPHIPSVFLYQFWENNAEEIMAFLKKFPRSDFSLHIKEAFVHLPRKHLGVQELITDFTLNSKGGVISLHGQLHKGRQDKKINKSSGWKYSLKGYLTNEGFLFDDLSLQSKNIFSRLWGSVRGDLLQFNGFTFVSTHASNRRHEETSLNVIERIKFFLRVLKGGPRLISDLAQQNIYLLDIDGLVRLTYPSFEIKHLDFTFNKAPLRLKGNLALAEPVSFDLHLSFFPVTAGTDELRNFEQANLQAAGILQNDAFHANGDLNLYFLNKPNTKGPIEKAKIDFKELVFNFQEYPQLKMDLEEGKTIFWTNGNEHKVSLMNLSAFMDLGTGEEKHMDFSSSFYDGTLKGKLWLDSGRLPFQINAEAVIQNADTNKLDELLIHFAKVKGRLNSKLHFRNEPDITFEGEISLLDGNVKNYKFFKWLANTFALSPLLSIDFSKALAHFSVNQEQGKLYNIDLESKDINIKGDFSINNRGLASSRLSLFFHRDLLLQSPKFRPVLKFFDKDTAFLDFDFQLSGNQHALNFQWLPSQTKKRIQDGIPDFIERIIERNIETTIETPSDN